MEKSYLIGRAMGMFGTVLPNGGTTGQVLAKKSNADQDVEWKTIETAITKDAIANALGLTTQQLDQLVAMTKKLTVSGDTVAFASGTTLQSTYFDAVD